MRWSLARLWAAFTLGLLACFAVPAAAQTFPKFTGLVVDDANVIPPDREAALTQKLQAFQQRTGRQLVVATIADLQGYPLEDYGYKLGRAWSVGLKDVNNGVILFIAPNNPAGQRGPRIEVGYGLEPVLTDALASIIINTRMMPVLKAKGDVPSALEAGAEAIMQQLALPDADAKAAQAKAIQEFDRTHQVGQQRRSGGGFPIGLIFWVIVAVFVFSSMRRGRRRGPWGSRQYQGGGSWPVWLWAASEIAQNASRNRGGGWSSGGGSSWGGGGGGGWGGGGFSGGGGGSFGGGGASGGW